MRRIVLFLSYVLPLLLLSCKQHQGSAELLERYIMAANQHDIKALLTMFSENIIWILGSDTLIGKKSVMAPHEFDAGAGTRLIIKSSIVKGDTVESILEETNDYMDTLGMSSVLNFPRFVFYDGLLIRIEPIRPQMIPPLVDSIDQQWNKWIQNEYPDAWAKIVNPDGSINYSRETGELLLRLACEWRQSSRKK